MNKKILTFALLAIFCVTSFADDLVDSVDPDTSDIPTQPANKSSTPRLIVVKPASGNSVATNSHTAHTTHVKSTSKHSKHNHSNAHPHAKSKSKVQVHHSKDKGSQHKAHTKKLVTTKNKKQKATQK